MGTTPLISVVTPVRARRQQLARLLSSLAAQECAGRLFEVVVVDNPRRYNDRWLQAAEWPFPLRYAWIPVGNRGLSRNVGARRAAADWLLFVDSDVVFAPGALRVMAEAVVDRSTSVVMADVVFPPGERRTLASHLFDVPAFYRRFRRQRRLGPLTFREFVSCSFLMSRSAFDAVGGFGEGFHYYGYEDVEFAWRAQTAGLSFELSTARAYHHKRLDPGAVLRQSVELGRSAVHLVRRHPDIEQILPVGVADTRSGVLAYHADFDIGPLVTTARSLERQWSRARRTAGAVDLRTLLAEARRCYCEISHFGRYTGITQELANEKGRAAP